VLTREDFDAAMTGDPPPANLTPDDIRRMVAARHEEALRERIASAMYLDLVVVQQRALASPEGIDEEADTERLKLWTDVTGEILADEAAARFMLGDAS
jgi:hypothetical protein